MANSKGKIIGLILVLILLAWIALRITPFYFAPFGIFSSISQTINHTVKGGLRFSSGFPFPFPMVPVFSLIMLILWIMVIAWVYRDAERRGMNGLLWALLVLIGNLIGLIIYLIIRSETRARPSRDSEVTCPACQKTVRSNFAFCPNCGKMLKPQCPKCQSEIQEGWKVCPHCGAKINK
jgi:hypothetical protein